MNKNVRLRLLCLVLAMVMVALTLVACAQPDEPEKEVQPEGETSNTESGEQEKEEEKEDDPYNIPDSLPKVTYGGREFNVLYFLESYVPKFYIESKTGDLIDDAVWSAIVTTEDRFDVNIGALKSAAEDENSFHSSIANQINAGTTDFDIANVHDSLGGNLSIQGYFLNVLEFDQFDFSKPWWPEKAVNTMSFMGQLYLISSTMSYNSLNTQAVFFNKQMMDDRGIEYPYEDVLDMNWYLEDMFALAEDVYTDLNSNEQKDAEDSYGVLVPQEFYCIWESYGINMIEKSEDGYELIFNTDIDRPHNLVLLYNYILNESEDGYADVRANTVKMFSNGQGMFLMTSLGYAATDFRSMQFSYGIVPYPMMDEQQGEYYSGYTDRYMVIPNNCLDRDFVGTIIESMSAEGYRQVIPAYYETALKGRYTHDSESVQMLELIRESAVIDFAYTYGTYAFCARGLYDLVLKKNTDYASYHASRLKNAEQRIEELTAFFEDME